MKHLNIPITIKESEFSSLSSYKKHTRLRQFYIWVLHLKKNIFILTPMFSGNSFTKLTYDKDIILISKQGQFEKGKL